MMSGRVAQRLFAGVAGLVMASSGGAATINVPPVVVSSLAHSRVVSSGPVQTTLQDSVFVPTGGGTYSGPGFTAAIGTGDTIVVRVQAPVGQVFNIVPGPGANATYFSFYLAWQTGVSDSASTLPTPTITFENFQGAAMTNTYALSYISNAGHAIVVSLDYTLSAPCAFSAVQLTFPVTQALASTPRTYGAVQGLSSPAIAATSIYNSNYPGSPIIMALGPASALGACCRGASCAVTYPANCSGGTAVHLGANVACNPTVRGGTVNACCPVDTNTNSIADVNDLFAYVGNWFAGCP